MCLLESACLGWMQNSDSVLLSRAIWCEISDLWHTAANIKRAENGTDHTPWSSAHHQNKNQKSLTTWSRLWRISTNVYHGIPETCVFYREVLFWQISVSIFLFFVFKHNFINQFSWGPVMGFKRSFIQNFTARCRSSALLVRHNKPVYQHPHSALKWSEYWTSEQQGYNQTITVFWTISSDK